MEKYKMMDIELHISITNHVYLGMKPASKTELSNNNIHGKEIIFVILGAN